MAAATAGDACAGASPVQQALRDLSISQRLQRAAEDLQQKCNGRLPAGERDMLVAQALLEGLDAACAGIARWLPEETTVQIVSHRRNEMLQESATLDLQGAFWFDRLRQGLRVALEASDSECVHDVLITKFTARRVLLEPFRPDRGAVLGFLFATDSVDNGATGFAVSSFLDVVSRWAAYSGNSNGVELESEIIELDVPELAEPASEAEGVAHDVAGYAMDVPREQVLISSTLEHVDQGLIVYDSELTILAMNGRVKELLSIPPGILMVGAGLQDFVRFCAERGDYGPGDAEALIAERMEIARRTSGDYSVDRLFEDGRIVACARRFTGDGRFIATYTDVTEWRQSQRDLDQKSALLSAALECTEQGLVVSDDNLVILAFNDVSTELLGVPDHVLRVGGSLLSLLEFWLRRDVPTDGDHGAEHTDLMTRVERPEDVSFEYRASQGSVVACTGRVRPNGGYVLTFDDVTDAKRGERELTEKSELLEATVQHMDQGLFAFDGELNMLYANERAKTMLGVPRGFFEAGQSLEAVVRHGAESGAYGDDDAETITADVMEKVRGDEPFSFEQLCLGGVTALVRCHPRPEGGFIFTFTDITESKQQQDTLTAVTDELRLKSVQLDSAFSSMSQGLVMFDADNRLVVCNPRYLELCDLPATLGRPGTALGDIMRADARFNTSLSIDEAIANRTKLVKRRDQFVEQGTMPNGRVVELVHEPLAEGGWLGLFTDITERKGQEIALREASDELKLKSQQLEKLFNNMVRGIAMFDADARLVICNELYAEIFQLPEELTRPGTNIYDMCVYCVEQGYEGNPENITEERIALAKNPERQDYQMLMADGRVIQSVHEPLDDGASIAMYEDVTERVRAEQQLRDYAGALEHQKEVLQTIMENMDQGISLIDQDLKVQAMNPRGMELLEFPLDNFEPGDGLEKYFRFNAERGEYGDGDADEQINARMELARKFEPHRFERTRPDGTLIEVRGAPVADGRGFVTTYTDVTETRKREAEVLGLTEQLTIANLQLDAAFNSMNQGLAMFDSEQRFVVRNKRYMELFRLTDDMTLPGTQMETVIRYSIEQGYEGAPENIVERRLEIARSRERVVFHRSMSDGRILEIIHEPLPDGGSVALYLDVTARLEGDRKLREYTAKLEVSNRELQDFAYVASHDLQEPLRKIEAFGDRLHRKFGDKLGEDGRLYVNRMQDSSRRLRTLINDLLDYSRVTTKARPFEPVDVKAAFEEVLVDLETTLEEAGGTVVLGDLPTLEGDGTQIRQIAINVISNALKFRQPEVAPLVRIDAQSIEDPTDGDEAWCELTFADNGIGFSNKYADRIFTIFQRLHSRSSYEGTGIGLATCRKIVERHGGEIDADGTPGEGAIFRIRLPLKQKQDAAGEEVMIV
jgi:PAS domain-containing protein